MEVSVVVRHPLYRTKGERREPYLDGTARFVHGVACVAQRVQVLSIQYTQGCGRMLAHHPSEHLLQREPVEHADVRLNRVQHRGERCLAIERHLPSGSAGGMQWVRRQLLLERSITLDGPDGHESTHGIRVMWGSNKAIQRWVRYKCLIQARTREGGQHARTEYTATPASRRCWLCSLCRAAQM